MEREYIGIDLHKAFFHACAITSTAERRWEQRWPTSDAGIAGLLARCNAHSYVAVEASSPTWAFVDRIVGHVGANGERDAVRGEDLLDRGFGFALIAQVDHDDGVAPDRERARDLAAGAVRATGDDRHWVGSQHAATLAAIAGGRASGFPGPPSLVV